VRADGAIILGADDGFVRALDPATGSVLWRFDTRKPVPDDTIESSPLLAPDGSVYFTSLDGKLYKLRGNGLGLSEVSNWPSFRGDAQRTGRARFGVESGRLLNLSVRAPVGEYDTLIAGFVVQGVAAKAYLLRGVGPGLGSFGVVDFLPDPRLEIYAGSVSIGGNDNWEEARPGLSVVDTAAAVGAFPRRRDHHGFASRSVFGTPAPGRVWRRRAPGGLRCDRRRPRKPIHQPVPAGPGGGRRIRPDLRGRGGWPGLREPAGARGGTWSGRLRGGGRPRAPAAFPVPRLVVDPLQ
jgi:hypothetical protein